MLCCRRGADAEYMAPRLQHDMLRIHIFLRFLAEMFWICLIQETVIAIMASADRKIKLYVERRHARALRTPS